MKKTAHKLAAWLKRALAVAIAGILCVGMIAFSDIYYDFSPKTAYGAELTGQSGNVSTPAWNAANIPARDTTGTVKYYYAGNAFHALNQLNDGVKQTGKGTEGHIKVYSDSYGARLVENKSGGKVVSVKGNFTGGSDFTSFSQRTDIDFDKNWELMDTDGVWDDQYLFAQYQTGAFAAVTTAFTPTILSTVNNWYKKGFSYDGSAAGRAVINPKGTSWFSSAEQNAVKSASVKTDGDTNSTNTNTAGDHLDSANLFAASIDEMYYNPVQVEEVITNLAADKSNVYNAESWQYARSHLWSRSFWGVDSGGHRGGFRVHSTGQANGDHVAGEFAVAPAFYLDLSKVVMARSAKAGTDVTANAALAAYNPSGISGDVKFLVKDSDFAPSFTSSINNKVTGNVVAGNTYSVDYSGAVTSTVNDKGNDNNSKLVISAAIYDNTGKILYYSPVANVTGTSGTVNIKIPSGLSKNTSYTLEVFEEQLGGTSTYSTKNNTNNGSTFTPTAGVTYKSYETDYKSGGSALMGITISDSSFDVQVKDGGYFYADRTYTASEVGNIVTASVGDNTLAVGEYYVLSKADFDSLGSTAYSTVTTSSKTNKVAVPALPGNDDGSIDVVFVYYGSEDSTAQIVEKTIKVVPDTIENGVEFDDKTWYMSKENDIEWYYKLNSNGDIIGLYTDSSIVPIVDSGNTLNVPSKVAGRTVIGIGSGSAEHPFISSSERSWTSISFPSSVAIIQDYAFLDSDASANIVIPSTITNIGVKAFYKASLVSLKVNDMNGTIGSLAFGETPNLDTVTIKGGSTGLVISTIGFRESHATSVTINGNVEVNKNAFKTNVSLRKIYINGTVKLNEYAFAGCTAVDNLDMSGRVSIGQYAFTNLTSLGHLYLPSTVTLEEYAFNDCTNLNRLETDTNLVNHSFEGCDQIQTLILDEHVSNVGYDWEGHCGSYSNRKIYVRNKNTVFDMYGNNTDYVSPFGSTGDVIVYIINDKTVDQGKDVEPDENILSLLGYTCYAHSSDYQNYIFGTAHSVTFYTTNNIGDQLERDNITLDDEVVAEQSGIDAYYDGVLLTTREIVKDNMKVIPVYGSNEGKTPYTSDQFYVIRTSDFNTLERNSELTLEKVSSLEPVTATDEDLDDESTTGTLSVTVIVFYEEDEQVRYFSTPVIVRLEQYTAESYVEQEYGSYENIVKNLAELSEKVTDLEKKIAELEAAYDPDAIDELTKELVAYKKAYSDLLEKFAEYLEATSADESGYFGEYTDPDTGEKSDVVYIGGEPTAYQDTGETTESGKKIYTGQYDTNDDGIKETIKFYVDEDGVHLVDDTGADTGDVYTDTLGAIQRQTAAKLKEVEDKLKTSQDGLNSIIEALKAAGYEFDLDITIDQAYRAIVEDINDMASRITELDGRLTTANNSISQYEQALANIYALLTNSTLEKDNIDGISNALNAIVEKISTLKNNLAVAQATVKDLQDQLDAKESALSALDQELQTTKDQLATANAEIREAEQAKSDLQAQYEKALADGDTAAAERLQAQIEETENALAQLRAVQGTLAQKEQDIKDAQDTILQLQKQIEDKNKEIELLQAQLDALTDTADGFKITVDTANRLFGLSLPDGATDKDISDAINEYVKQKLSADETIEAIQRVVNSTNTGTDLVDDVRNAVGTGTSAGMIDDTVVNTKSNNYKSGYQAGYEAGAAAGGTLDDTVINKESNNYKSGYAAGVLAGSTGKTDDDTVNVNSESYKKGYSIGYNEGYLKAAKDLGGESGNNDNGNNNSGKSSSSEVESLKSQVTTLTGQVSALTTKNSELSAQVSDLTNKNSNLTNDVSKLNTNLKTATDENSTLKKKVNKLDDKVDDLEDDNKDLENKNSSLESSNSSLTSEVGSLKTEVDGLKSTNSGLQNQVTDLTSKNNSLNDEVTNLKSRNMASTSTTTTTNTTKNSSSETTKKKEKEKDKKDKDDEELDGSTAKIDTVSEAAPVLPDPMASGTLVAAENSQKKLGTTSEISMFSDSQINSMPPGQYAQGKVIKFTESNPVVKISDSNGKGINDISEESLNNIYKIFQYYANHIEDLGNMGSDDVVNAAADETKSVILKVVAAGDILPNQHQEAAFANQQSAKLETSFPGIVNGALYLMVHERADNPGQYELCLTTASDDNLSMNVSSLSPVGIAKVEIKDAAATADGTLTDAEAEPMAAPANQNKRSGLGIILIVLLFLVLIVTGAFILITKLKREGRLPEFLSGVFAEE